MSEHEQAGYEGPVCPACGRIAFAFWAGHTAGCEYAKPAKS